MKAIAKKIYILMFLTAVGAGLWSCNEEESGGDPFVHYVRVTDPAASDSLLVSTYQGQMIAIMGDNLMEIRELWFNDLPATLDPTFITNTTVISRVPSRLPSDINNMMTMVFKNGDSLKYDFSVDISEPVINRAFCEYLVEGGVGTIYGDYFYEPLSITFTGGAQATVYETIDDQTLIFQVPAGVQPGPVTITSNFGEAESEFWFQDNRGVFVDFNTPLSGSLWHPSGGASSLVPSTANIAPIDGAFLYTLNDYGAWSWTELFTGTAEAPELAGMTNIPEAALSNPGAYSFKFELNTLADPTGASVNIYIGNNVGGANRGPNSPDTYSWTPNIHTEGEWQTVVIPWETVYTEMGEFPYSATGYGISMVVQGPNSATLDFGIDNMRVVPTVSE